MSSARWEVVGMVCLHVQDDQDGWGSRCQERKEKIGQGGNDMPKWRCEEGSCIMDSGDTRRVETSLGYTSTRNVSVDFTFSCKSRAPLDSCLWHLSNATWLSKYIPPLGQRV